MTHPTLSTSSVAHWRWTSTPYSVILSSLHPKARRFYLRITQSDSAVPLSAVAAITCCYGAPGFHLPSSTLPPAPRLLPWRPGPGGSDSGGHVTQSSVFLPPPALRAGRAAARAARRCMTCSPSGSGPHHRATSDELLDSIRLSSARLSSAQLGSAWLGSTRLDSARLGSARFGLPQSAPARLH